MTAATKNVSSSRKRSTASQPSRRTSTAVSSSPSAQELAKEIRERLNQDGTTMDVRADAARLDELRRLFARLEQQGELTFGETTKTSNKTVQKWRQFLSQSHKNMVDQLMDRIIKYGRHSAVRCLFGVIAASPITASSTNSSRKHIHADLLRKWIHAIVSLNQQSQMDKGMRHMIDAEFMQPYRDVQYYSLGCITSLATELQKKKNGAAVAQTLLDLLLMIPVPMSRKELLQDDGQFLFPPTKEEGEAKHDSSEEDEDESDDSDDSDDTDDSDQEEKTTTASQQRRPNKRKRQDALASNKASFQQIKYVRREYQKAWLAVLQLELPLQALKRALQFLPRHVLDYVPSPLRFADFFMGCYSTSSSSDSDEQEEHHDDSSSGIVSVLALDGIFKLLVEYELEYPDFYTQLYQLVSSHVLYAKYRLRFFVLLTNCLMRNDMLPAHVVAAFVKKLCRSALSGPPTGALFVLALVSNLLRKHPECNCLIHRSTTSTNEKTKKGEPGTTANMEDPFLPHEKDPVKCQALQSSLWELEAFERHYYPAIATLAKSIGTEEESKAPFHDIEAFASHTYKSLFDQEKKKKMKTALTFQEPTTLFTKQDIFSDMLHTGP